MSAQTVSRAEGLLLSVARAALGFDSSYGLRRLLLSQGSPPERLSPPAMRLLEETLSKGVVHVLAAGGWQPLAGRRLWQRQALPTLEFTPTLFRFLQWLVRMPLGEAGSARGVAPVPFTPAESVVVASLLHGLRGSGLESAVLSHPGARATPLLQLGFAGELATVAPLEATAPVDVRAHLVFLEGLADLFAASWLAAESRLAALETPAQVRQVAAAQSAVLEPFLAALTGHREAALFLVRAGSQWTGSAPTPEHYGRRFKPELPLSERTAARRASLVLLRALATLSAWHEEHRVTRFTDDGYPEAQALLPLLAPLARGGFAAAARLVAQVDGLPG